MAVLTFTSTERPRELSNANWQTCCGLPPTVLYFERADATNVCCANPACDNHESKGGVFADPMDISEKWAIRKIVWTLTTALSRPL